MRSRSRAAIRAQAVDLERLQRFSLMTGAALVAALLGTLLIRMG